MCTDRSVNPVERPPDRCPGPTLYCLHPKCPSTIQVRLCCLLPYRKTSKCEYYFIYFIIVEIRNEGAAPDVGSYLPRLLLLLRNLLLLLLLLSAHLTKCELNICSLSLSFGPGGGYCNLTSILNCTAVGPTNRRWTLVDCSSVCITL